MNLKSVIVVLSLLFLSINGVAQSNYVQKLGDLATVTLPDTPKIIEQEGIKRYILNHGLGYLVLVADENGGLKDLFAPTSPDSLFNTFLKSMLATSKGRVLYRDKIKINGHDAWQFGATTMVKDKEIYGYYRSVTLNDTMIVCGIMSSDSVSKDHEVLKTYFANFKLVSVEKLAGIKTHNTAYKAGKVIGVLLVILFFAGIGFGIVVLIKKLVYKKEI